MSDEQKATIQLTAILRLANALDAGHDGHIRRIQIGDVPRRSIQTKAEADRKKPTNGFLRKYAGGLAKGAALMISAEGYSPLGPSARTIAAERHLLETVLHRPVVVRAMKIPPHSPNGARNSKRI
jgi:hypothetical protein